MYGEFMNEYKLYGNGSISLSDSLKAPLLDLDVKLTSNESVNSNDLIIYVDTDSSISEDRKSYIFTLDKPLEYSNGISDEFILTPKINGTKVELIAKVIRRVVDGLLLDVPYVEFLDYQPIIMFEGNNYITTNYSNTELSITYPKDTDEMNIFASLVLEGLNSKNRILSLDDIYFKDCFTQIEDDLINALFNKITIKCMNSTNGTFSIDCQGNMTVKTLTTEDGLVTPSSGGGVNIDDIYPVGSIYMNVNNVNPNTLFGGTWVQLQDRFLIGAGNEYIAGEVGGSKYLQEHSHSIPSLSGSTNWTGGHSHQIGADKDGYYRVPGGCYTVHSSGVPGSGYQMWTSGNGDHSHTVTTNASNTGNAGSGNAENMPPYLPVYIWKRTA